MRREIGGGGCCGAQDIDPEDGEDAANLGEKGLGVGDLGLGEPAGLRPLLVVGQGAALGAGGDVEEAGLEIAPVPFVEGVVPA